MSACCDIDNNPCSLHSKEDLAKYRKMKNELMDGLVEVECKYCRGEGNYFDLEAHHLVNCSECDGRGKKLERKFI